ncbi:SDR family NAD(P)-dependent oxidoreductase [Novosphingobium sp. TH158]|uniref:SDR family NAD(P)-dependent oxidoreductase n=1 Tax=Novosphingobium sp. TH158 TaxID=2067455 RepID=UPI000C7CB31B|nr:SDR family NAD(P)-dependent oxidoreductase [Novosphingobium sp. TH158]PLK26948.1 short-chain dehydrogenase [Novosphingobium sp. TH158]
MTELRFDNRVAVITGGGRGLGAAHAKLLASRGCKVVVNDPGVSMAGDATDEGPADALVREIREAGGEAVANTDSVATPEGGEAIIRTALDTWGRIDVLIHSAGNVRRAPLAEMTAADWQSVIDVHLNGAFHVTRPAFAAMMAAGYGRIVMTSSVNGVYSNKQVANYSAAKGGLIGLANTAAIEGFAANVKANCILPAAVTRMSEGVDTSQFPPMTPEMVAPLVAYLCHESCEVTGELLISAAGRMARAWTAESPGVFKPEWSIEDVAANIGAIRDMSAPVHFPPAPQGHLDHLFYSFGMARGG